jgi:hypothetical protein
MAIVAGTYRGAPKLTGAPLVAQLVRLLEGGCGAKRAAREFQRVTGVRISHQTADDYRRRLGLAPLRARLALAPCDLCGASPGGPRYDGAPWALEGRICGPCRSELVAERRAAAYRAAQARRKREFQARAVRCRVEARSLRPGLIVNGRFSTYELRGRALTHWLKAVLARGDAPAVLMAEESE